MANELVKAEGNYAVTKTDIEQVRALIEDRLDGEPLRLRDLPKIGVPKDPGEKKEPKWDLPMSRQHPDGETVKEFNAIILSASQTRTWWGVSFNDREEGARPKCRGQRESGVWVGYSEEWTSGKQECSRCPVIKEQMGGENGCRTQFNLLLAVEGRGVIPCLLVAPATSVRGIDDYIRSLKFSLDLNPGSVVTTFALTRTKTKSGYDVVTVKPSMAGPLDEEQAARSAAFASLIRELLEAGRYQPAQGGEPQDGGDGEGEDGVQQSEPKTDLDAEDPLA